MKKDDLLNLIWTDFVQIYTNIIYSSLYSERLRKKQNDLYFWAIYGCFALPSVVSLIFKKYAINHDWLFILIIVAIVLLPLAVRIKNKKLVYTVFGIHEKEINGLLKLNEDLDRYKDGLLALYFQIDGMSEKSSKWSEMELRYRKLKDDNARYVTEHDKLTGEIDQEIQQKAQEQTDILIKRANYYGKEDNTESQ